MFFLGALYMQQILGYAPLEVGLAFLPSAVVMGALSVRYSEKLIMDVGARATLVGGLTAAAIGLVLFSLAPVDGSFIVNILPVMLLLGLGAGLAFPALMTLAMSGATPQDAGLASGLINTTTQVGGAIGLAVLATLATEQTESARAAGESALTALNSGFHLAYLIGAALVVLAIGVALVVVRTESEPVEGDEGTSVHSLAAAEAEAVYAEAA
jgi:MFS family permease